MSRTTPTTMASLKSPRAAARAAAPARIATRTLRNWSANRCQAGRPGGSARRLGAVLRPAPRDLVDGEPERGIDAEGGADVAGRAVVVGVRGDGPRRSGSRGGRGGQGHVRLRSVGPEVSPARRASQAHRAGAVVTMRLNRGTPLQQSADGRNDRACAARSQTSGGEDPSPGGCAGGQALGAGGGRPRRRPPRPSRSFWSRT